MKTARNLIMLAYDDYLCSRFLINNKFILHGVTSASTAIEKYFKAILMVKIGTVEKVHLNKINKLRAQFKIAEYDELFDYLDEVFLSILGKAYKFRYYDNIKEPDTIGFFVNQFLGELDHTVYKLEQLFIVKKQNGSDWQSPYKKAINKKDQRLFENNFILNRIDKKEFMEEETDGFALFFDPYIYESYILESTQKLPVQYNDKILPINVGWDKKHK